MEPLAVKVGTNEYGSTENCTANHLTGGNAFTDHSGDHHHVKDYGTYIGHTNPGMMATVYGVLWTYNTIKRYQVARREAVLKGHNTKKLNFKCMLFSGYHDGCCARAPVEALVLVVITALGVSGEFIRAFKDGMFVFAYTHHMCMFFFFNLVGVTKILMHYKNSLPPKSDTAMFIVANVVEALLFSGHVAGRAAMNAQVHMLLVYSILTTAAFAGLELVFPRSVLASLGRTFSLIVHGVWFLVVGLILYPPSSLLPKWDQEDHGQMTLVTTIFVTVIAAVIIGALIINRIIICKVKRLNLTAITRMQSMYYGHTLACTPDGDPEKPLISDSDIEC